MQDSQRFLFFRSDNNSIHDREVALGALEAKNEMEKEQPEITLKHDPTAGMNLEKVIADKRADMRRRENHGAAAAAAAVVNDFPPGLEAFLPQDPMERERMIAEQRQIEQLIRRGGDRNPAAHAAGGPAVPLVPYRFMLHHDREQPLDLLHRPFMYPWLDEPLLRNNEQLLHRMGELLRLREDQRQRRRAIRDQEQRALLEVRRREIGVPPPPPQVAFAVGPQAQPPQLAPVGQPHHQLINPLQPNNPHPFGGPMVFPPPPAHLQVPPRGVPPPPPAHPGVPRPAHVAPQPPALPLTFGPQGPDLPPNPYRFQLEPLPLHLRRHGPIHGQPAPAAGQQQGQPH